MDAASMHRKKKIEGEDKNRERMPKDARNSKNELKAKTAVHQPIQIATDNIETCLQLD
jgi:hypothetical protein